MAKEIITPSIVRQMSEDGEPIWLRICYDAVFFLEQPHDAAATVVSNVLNQLIEDARTGTTVDEIADEMPEEPVLFPDFSDLAVSFRENGEDREYLIPSELCRYRFLEMLQAYDPDKVNRAFLVVLHPFHRAYLTHLYIQESNGHSEEEKKRLMAENFHKYWKYDSLKVWLKRAAGLADTNSVYTIDDGIINPVNVSSYFLEMQKILRETGHHKWRASLLKVLLNTISFAGDPWQNGQAKLAAAYGETLNDLGKYKRADTFFRKLIQQGHGSHYVEPYLCVLLDRNDLKTARKIAKKYVPPDVPLTADTIGAAECVTDLYVRLAAEGWKRKKARKLLKKYWHLIERYERNEADKAMKKKATDTILRLTFGG